MSPLKISMLLHYFVSPTDFRDGDFSAPAVREAINDFLQEGFLREAGRGSDEQYKAAYFITDKGRFYVDALCAVPAPVAVWTIPQVDPVRNKGRMVPGDWIVWMGGGECPVDRNTCIQVRYSNGSVTAPAGPVGYDWNHSGDDHDIIAYRILKEVE
ncbi:MAG: hypothetical protein J0I15_07030 [Herbaspirillum huttiense]|uniref:hypothetical protein n=1 Tax=Herbaspirillum huttiense TaxID=863372 RepID=UPI001ACD0F34|nr:hypothetical protein [Herbaspirillum huttiense]MBN9356183.1 hypothetical protein [Herbaspirillum huttiense]